MIPAQKLLSVSIDKGVLKIYKVYKANYADECPEVVVAHSDYDALGEALDKEDKHGPLLGLYEICADGPRKVV